MGAHWLPNVEKRAPPVTDIGQDYHERIVSSYFMHPLVQTVLTSAPYQTSENQSNDARKIAGPIVSHYTSQKEQDLCLPRSDPTSPRLKVCVTPMSSGWGPVADESGLIGCYQCSRRRIHCDRTEPSCQKCASRGLRCSGLGLRLRFMLDGCFEQNVEGLSTDTEYVCA